jgi:amino acid transporter
MFVGTIIITIMYLGLTYSIAEMSPALPHTGGAYKLASSSSSLSSSALATFPLNADHAPSRALSMSS